MGGGWHKLELEKFLFDQWEDFLTLLVERWTRSLERWWGIDIPPPWRHSKLMWAEPWGICSDWFCLEQTLG